MAKPLAKNDRRHAPSLEPGEFVVEIRVTRRIVVKADDEIQADFEAAKKLSQKDRAAADSVRIVAGRYPNGQPYRPDADQPWCGINRQWWAEQGIIP